MRIFSFSELEDIDSLHDDDIVVLDDRHRRFDEKSGSFVNPGQPGYDDLPDIDFNKL